MEHGTHYDLGIVGKDTIMEQGRHAFLKCWSLQFEAASAGSPWR